MGVAWVSQVVLVVKNPPANAGDLQAMGLIPGSGRPPGGGKGSPLQCSCLENPMDRGAWWAAVHRVTKSWTRLKWLSAHTRALVNWILLIRDALQISSQICLYFQTSFTCIHWLSQLLLHAYYVSALKKSWIKKGSLPFQQVLSRCW